MKINLPAVFVLLFSTGPSAIARFIWTVVVDAIQRHSLRSRPHVSDEIGVKAPSFAKRDATSAVVAEIFSSWIRAALDHVDPGVELWRPLATLRSAMQKVLQNNPVTVETSAASRVITNEMISENRNPVATLTTTVPGGFPSVVIRSTRFDGQTAKTHANQFTAPHGYILPRSKEMNIKKLLTKAAAFAVLALSLGGIAHAQNALTQTTLASAVNGPALYSGTSSTIDQVVTLASVTGISAPTLPGTPISVIYVGREAMGVFSVNTTAKTVNVFRGYLGTQASPHPSGDMVLVAPAYNTANGGNPVPNGLFPQDPPAGGACTAAGTPTAPWVNVLTGAQWLCSSITKTWIPGFVNPLTTVVDAPNTAVASATTILPTGPLFHLTGVTAVTTITTPIGCDATAVGGCQFTVIVDTGAAAQFATGGNLEIGASITTLAGKAYSFIWDASTSKWTISG